MASFIRNAALPANNSTVPAILGVNKPLGVVKTEANASAYTINTSIGKNDAIKNEIAYANRSVKAINNYKSLNLNRVRNYPALSGFLSDGSPVYTTTSTLQTYRADKALTDHVIKFANGSTGTSFNKSDSQANYLTGSTVFNAGPEDVGVLAWGYVAGDIDVDENTWISTVTFFTTTPVLSEYLKTTASSSYLSIGGNGGLSPAIQPGIVFYDRVKISLYVARLTAASSTISCDFVGSNQISYSPNSQETEYVTPIVTKVVTNDTSELVEFTFDIPTHINIAQSSNFRIWGTNLKVFCANNTAYYKYLPN